MIVASLTGCLMRCSVQLQRRRHDQGTAFLFPYRTNCKADSRASFCTSFLIQEYGFRHFILPRIHQLPEHHSTVWERRPLGLVGAQ
jgi:hypothetical protein